MKWILFASVLVTFAADLHTSATQSPSGGINEIRAARRVDEATEALDRARAPSLSDAAWEAYRERVTEAIRSEVVRYMQSDISPGESPASIEAKVRTVLRSHPVDSEYVHPPTVRSVSYTHLTLPTICSV